MKVATTEGEIEASELIVKDVPQWSDNARVIATEWYLNGKLVRRDVWANVLRAEKTEVKRGC
jgi:hypothetical protein